MEQNNRPTNDGEAIVTLIKMLVLAGVAYLLFLLVVYVIVLALVGGAIYLGIKLGSGGSGGTFGPVPEYQKIKQINARQEEHLTQLEGESLELLELARGSFEDQKMQLYRPKDEIQRPGIDLDKAREVIDRVKNMF